MQLETIQNKMGTFVTVLDRNKTQWQRNIKIVKEWGDKKRVTSQILGQDKASHSYYINNGSD